MAKFKGKYRIESNRWQYWDYSSPGQYFITICIAGMQCILGIIKDKKMYLSSYGKIVAEEIQEMPNYHPRCMIDEWIVMPNHIHLIIVLSPVETIHELSKTDPKTSPNDPELPNAAETIHELSLQAVSPPTRWWHYPDYIPNAAEIKRYQKQRRKMLIPKLVGKMKAQTSREINIERKTPGISNWQANYHDHVIRNENSYKRIKNYIINNPANWEDDTFHP